VACGVTVLLLVIAATVGYRRRQKTKADAHNQLNATLLQQQSQHAYAREQQTHAYQQRV